MLKSRRRRQHPGSEQTTLELWDKIIAINEALIGATPMKRRGQPEKVAGAVAFLVSSAAGYITGQAISVSGGPTMV